MSDPQLRPDQIEDLAKLINHPKHIHGGEPGTGKTPTICTYQRYLSEHEGTGSVWTMPLSLLQKNYDEALKWGGWSPKDVCMVTNNNPRSDARLYLMGFERLESAADAIPDSINAVQIDECHKAHISEKSQRTQALFRFIRNHRVKNLTPMTGTLFRGKPESCYPILSQIESRYYGNLQGFKNTHEVRDLWTGDVIGYKNLDKLQTILNRHSIKRRFEDIFGKQEVVIQRETVQMSAKQQAYYDEFETAALLELEQFWVDGTQPGLGFIRARQILEHPERFPNLAGEGTVDILEGEQNGKLTHIIDLLEEEELKPIIIFASLRHQQDLIAVEATRLGYAVGQINGDVSPRIRSQIDADFRAGKINCIIASPACADVGFNWQRCGEREVNHVIFASLDYDDSTFVQAYKRVIRSIRLAALRITVLCYNARVDYRVLQIVRGKSETARLVDPTREVLRL